MNKAKNKKLSEACPELIQAEWFSQYNSVLGIDPAKITTANGKAVFWKCPKCQSIYQMTPRKRLDCIERNKTSCFSCRGKVQLHSFTI